jgi:hypothetical protein
MAAVQAERFRRTSVRGIGQGVLPVFSSEGQV